MFFLSHPHSSALFLRLHKGRVRSPKFEGLRLSSFRFHSSSSVRTYALPSALMFVSHPTISITTKDTNIFFDLPSRILLPFYCDPSLHGRSITVAPRNTGSQGTTRRMMTMTFFWMVNGDESDSHISSDNDKDVKDDNVGNKYADSNV